MLERLVRLLQGKQENICDFKKIFSEPAFFGQKREWPDKEYVLSAIDTEVLKVVEFNYRRPKKAGANTHWIESLGRVALFGGCWFWLTMLSRVSGTRLREQVCVTVGSILQNSLTGRKDESMHFVFLPFSRYNCGAVACRVRRGTWDSLRRSEK